MPLAKKAEGYPVDAERAAAAVAEPTTEVTSAARVIKETGTQPSAKDRSIVRQVAWKVAGFALVNWTGTPEAWFEKAVEYVEKIEKHIHSA